MLIFHTITLVFLTINYLWIVFLLIRFMLLPDESDFNFVGRTFVFCFLNMLLSAALVLGAWGLYVYFKENIGFTFLKQLLTTCN